MLTNVAEDIWTVGRPLSFFGLRVGTRMTVVRLRDGSLFVHSPVALDDTLRKELDELGPVAHIVAPNLYHHLYAGELRGAYPEATLHAPAGLAKKRSDLKIDAQLGATADHAWKGQLEQLLLDGTMLQETVFFHSATRTLISCDVVENFETHEHWLTRGYLKAGGIHGKPGLSIFFRPLFRDRKAARRSVDTMLEWDPKGIVLSHGELIESDGRNILEQTYAWL